MISEKARQILSEEMSEDGEQEVIFLEDGNECVVFRLFRAREGTGDPELRAIRWLDRVSALCRSAPGELRTGLIRSRDEGAIMAAASGRAIEAREWPPEEHEDRVRQVLRKRGDLEVLRAMPSAEPEIHLELGPPRMDGASTGVVI